MSTAAGPAEVPLAQRKIFAMGGGGFTMEPTNPLLDDFVISQTPGATHVRNAPSPAATSSLALASELVDRFEASTT